MALGLRKDLIEYEPAAGEEERVQANSSQPSVHFQPRLLKCVEELIRAFPEISPQNQCFICAKKSYDLKFLIGSDKAKNGQHPPWIPSSQFSSLGFLQKEERNDDLNTDGSKAFAVS